MKVLVVGSGAREHALAWKCMQSPLAERVYCAPGNGGSGGMARNVAVQADDVTGLVRFSRREKVSLVVLGPESAVAAAAGDALRDAGIPVFGPDREAGRIETSKAFAKELMREAGIPTPDFGVFTDPGPARAWARAREGRVAVKADGLALGKGVVVCGSVDQAERAIDAMLVARTFGKAGATVVVEERLEGPELSLFGVTDGRNVVPLAPARDFKRARQGDEGPNTGGMGAYSPPAGTGPAEIQEAVAKVLEPAVAALAARGLEYRGVLYAGLIQTSSGLRCLEFNARFGDPEAQVVLPRLDSDLLPLMLTAARGDLAGAPEPRWSSRASVGIVVACAGYPDAYETGAAIEGLTAIPPGVLVFHAGTRYVPGRGLVTSGGRVVTSVGLGETVADARLAALAGAVRVRFPGAYYRTDIAQEAVLG
ncbi:MAG: phosphoribosylamine--glycine ligase [Candidatus Dormibacterales bacterium]